MVPVSATLEQIDPQIQGCMFGIPSKQLHVHSRFVSLDRSGMIFSNPQYKYQFIHTNALKILKNWHLTLSIIHVSPRHRTHMDSCLIPQRFRQSGIAFSFGANAQGPKAWDQDPSAIITITLHPTPGWPKFLVHSRPEFWHVAERTDHWPVSRDAVRKF